MVLPFRMARQAVAYGLVGLTVVFLVMLLVLPYVQSYVVSGFEDMSCEEGSKPCDEGYFCQQKTCVPISPKFNIGDVKPGAEGF